MPAPWIWKLASPSGSVGESITLQTRVSARPLRKWRRVVDAWAMMFPPIGAICGPKDIASGFATTWLVMTHATPYLSQREEERGEEEG